MSAGLYPAFQFFDNNGEPLNGGLVYTYEPGTTTPKASYQDAALTTPQANPIVLSAFGRPPAPIWLNGETKVVVKTAADVTLDTVDNVNAGIAGLAGWATKQDGVILKSANYDLTAADDGKTLVATSGSWTLGTADAASIMGEGFVIDFLNTGAGTITFDPNGSETVNGDSSVTFGQGDGGRLVCDGSNWRILRTCNVERPGLKNRVINGDFRIDQRNGGAAVTVNATSIFFGPDLWRGIGHAADGAFTFGRSNSSPPAGFSHFLRMAVTTADASIGASQLYRVFTLFEGANMLDLGFGAAGAKVVTLSFWARSSLTGTFGGALVNASGARCYPFTFSISAANTWERKSIVIPGDTAGTWPTDTNSWGSVTFDLGSGASARGTPGAWVGPSVVGATGAVSLISTLSATLDLAGIQLEVGSTATEFERLSFGESLQQCQRYFCKTYAPDIAPGTVSSTGYRGVATNGAGVGYIAAQWPVVMRATPTVTLYNHSLGTVGTWRDGGATDRAVGTTGLGDSGGTLYNTAAAALNSSIGGHWTAAAEL